LSSISLALGLDAKYLDEVLTGVRTLDETTDEPSLRSISDMLARFAGRFDAIENRLGKIDATVTEQCGILYRMAPPEVRLALRGHRPDQDAPGPGHQDDPPRREKKRKQRGLRQPQQDQLRSVRDFARKEWPLRGSDPQDRPGAGEVPGYRHPAGFGRRSCGQPHRGHGTRPTDPSSAAP
jgi:hypothetical protein